MNISFQLYSARHFQPYEDVLRQLAGWGYTQVEGFGGVYDNPAAFRAALDKNSLSMPSGHFSLDLLKNDFAGAESIAKTLGIGTIICPFLPPDKRPSDAAGWRDLAKHLETIGQHCRQAGFTFAWHNHDFEFQTLDDGSTIQQIILDEAPGIGWEMDVAWVARGEADPLAWIDAYGPRIIAVHVKDIAPAGQCADEDGWADVGHGVLPWGEFMAAIRGKTPAELLVMEHDNPNDLARFASRSITALQAL